MGLWVAQSPCEQTDFTKFLYGATEVTIAQIYKMQAVPRLQSDYWEV